MLTGSGESDVTTQGTAAVLVTPALPPLPHTAAGKLLAAHRDHLYTSGLTDATIDESGIYSECDPHRLQLLLKWKHPVSVLGAAIVIPFRNQTGEFSGYARLRPDKPRAEGGKYESPLGEPNHAYFPPAVIDAINTPGASLGFTEGEKKSLAACQAGLPCIGLTGVWNWQKPRSAEAKAADSPRQLIEDLAAIDWRNRTVWIAFDTDPRRNPSVNQALAELARVLTEHGAHVVIVQLPVGKRDEEGIPGKMAVDDFIVEFGDTTFYEFVQRELASSNLKPIAVETYQEDLRSNRLASLNSRGVVFLDRSPTGSGKSTADIPAMIAAGSSLTVLATHRNCEEKERELCDRYEMHAAKYPQLNADTCVRYLEAEKVLQCGLTVSGALCPTCPHRECCEYNLGMQAAELAPHRIATHKRAELSFDTIANQRRYIALHEDPVTILRPMIHLGTPLEDIISIANHCRREAMQWANLEAPFFWYLENAAYFLTEQLAEADETTELTLPAFTTPPHTVDATLWKAIQKLKLRPNAEAMRACKALASGHVSSLCVRVDTILLPGAVPTVERSIIVIWRTMLPAQATIWLSDATADPDEIREVSNLPVVDCTPGGTIRQRHPVLQIPVDVKKATSQATVIRTLRAVLAKVPNAQRIGIICDRKHISAIQGTAKSGDMLTEEERSRITKIEYFRGGEGRGSNTWTVECDQLIVLGTPRVPPTVIKSRLIRRNNTIAAARKDEWISWGPDYWSGRTVSGELHTVRTLAYRDRDWHSAYTSVVRAELQQCIGRGRSIRENGIPTLVVTNEDLGVTLVDYELQTLNDFDEQVLTALQSLCCASDTVSKGAELVPNTDLSDSFPNIVILEKVSVSCLKLTTHLHANERAVRRSLNRLERAGRARRIGVRGGWTVE